MPKTIVYLKIAQAFAVGFVRRHGIRSTEQSFGVLRLLDQTSFECICQFWSLVHPLVYSPLPRVAFCEVPCDPAEHINAMHSVTLPAATYLCVGTVVVDPHDLEPTKGRLVIFKVNTDGDKPSLHLVSSTPVRGCVYSIVSKDNTLALAVNSAVNPSRVETEEEEFLMKVGFVGQIIQAR